MAQLGLPIHIGLSRSIRRITLTTRQVRPAAQKVVSNKLKPAVVINAGKNTCAYNTFSKLHRHLSGSSVRLFSDKSGSTDDLDHEDSDVDEMKRIDLDKDKFIDDPELKSIVNEIKRDFENKTKENKTKVPPGTNETEKSAKNLGVSTDDYDINSGRMLLDETDQEFAYDYRVADDIEEYDYKTLNELAQQQVRPEKILPISLERGKSGVFDLDELLILLEDLGAQDIVSFPVPPEANFCDHMVIVSAKSRRHLQAINEELLWIHKRKKSSSDHHLVIEGEDKSEWCAMDMGNIVLHTFFGPAREYYDIESLWTLGPEHDPKCQEQSHDPYALSPEDLFWLETSKSSDSAKEDSGQAESTEEQGKIAGAGVVHHSKKPAHFSRQVQDKDAGWGSTKHPTKD